MWRDVAGEIMRNRICRMNSPVINNLVRVVEDKLITQRGDVYGQRRQQNDREDYDTRATICFWLHRHSILEPDTRSRQPSRNGELARVWVGIVCLAARKGLSPSGGRRRIAQIF